jgi:hypothetical protein
MNIAASRVLASAVLLAAAAAQADEGTPPQAPPATLREAWLQALSMLRMHKVPGLVFVLPPEGKPADAKAAAAAVAELPGKGLGHRPVTPTTARELLLLQIQALRADRTLVMRAPAIGRPDRNAMPVDLAAAFALALPIVAEAEVCGSKPGETLLLFGPDGARTHGFAVDLGDARAVADAVLPHLASAKALLVRQANVPPALQRAADTFDAARASADQSDMERRNAAYLELSRNVHAAAPALLDVQDGEVLVRHELRAMVEQTVPVGTVLAEQWDPCPPCGMMAVPLPMRSALKLLAR